jgi:hypothetical protein
MSQRRSNQFFTVVQLMALAITILVWDALLWLAR